MTYYTVTLFADVEHRVIDTYLFLTYREANLKKDNLFRNWREYFTADYRQIFNSDGYTLVKEGDKTMLEIKIEMHEV